MESIRTPLQLAGLIAEHLHALANGNPPAPGGPRFRLRVGSLEHDLDGTTRFNVHVQHRESAHLRITVKEEVND